MNDSLSAEKDVALPGLCRRCGLSKRAAIAGVLCDPPYAGAHDFPACNCNQRGGYLKAHGPDPARRPAHGDTRVTASDKDSND